MDLLVNATLRGSSISLIFRLIDDLLSYTCALALQLEFLDSVLASQDRVVWRMFSVALMFLKHSERLVMMPHP